MADATPTGRITVLDICLRLQFVDVRVVRQARTGDGLTTALALGCCSWRIVSSGKRPTLLIYRVICTDHDAMHFPEEDIGNLRVALNALVRLFRL